jgi:hypothetical protein
MSATLTTAALPFMHARPEGRPRPGGLTLEQRLEGSWQDLRLRGAAECPICRGPMHRAANGAGECTDCGSKLA